jgi:hypothetical protein
MYFMKKPKTPYTETEILLAMLENNSEHAEKLAEDMNITELNSFIAHINQMQTLVIDIRSRKICRTDLD